MENQDQQTAGATNVVPFETTSKETSPNAAKVVVNVVDAVDPIVVLGSVAPKPVPSQTDFHTKKVVIIITSLFIITV